MDNINKLIGAKKEDHFLADREIVPLPLPDPHSPGVDSEEDVDDMLATIRTRGLDVLSESELHLPYSAERTFAKATEEGVDLDLTPGAPEAVSDPVRVYLREMGASPLLTREGEVEIAKRIERGQLSMLKALSRSPVVIHQVLTLGDDLKRGVRSITEIVVFDEEEVTDEILQSRVQEITRRIDQLQKHYKIGCRLAERLEAFPEKDKKKARAYRRCRCELGRIPCFVAAGTERMRPKYIFVTGGVVSSLGKGVAAASIGCLLESRGLRVTLQKCDPYLNVDPGTMSPYQHGEVFVTDDGAETDLDLGHYERFASAHLTKDHNWTTGRIYESIIAKERRGDYLGKTVQVIPHVTDEIKAAFRKVADGVDIVIVEIGGTVGDIESLPFMEAIRQMRLELGPENTVFVHVTLVPFIATAGELKTKPTQHSVKEMLNIGIQPDILLCRSDRWLSPDLKCKIALFCNVGESRVISAQDVDTIYAVPVELAREGPAA